MCGIAGWLGRQAPEEGPAAVQKMVTAMAHRGPDGEGLERWDKATLGQRRLAIFDLSDAGRQPMVTVDRQLAVVFNGAIFNFRQLRQELESAGYSFRTQTDTEILLAGYRHWGMAQLLPRLRGMFGICLWDNEKEKAWLFRDRLGVKPLYYAEKNGQLAFASTARALAASGWAGALSPAAVAAALEFGFVPDHLCIYEGVHKVPAGGLIEFDARSGSSRHSIYWTPPPAAESGISFPEAVEETERLLLQAVTRRLDADVPVGALLSGGIDSALVCWAIAHLGGDIQALTIGTPGEASDETADAEATARTLGIRHQVLALNAETAPRAREIAEAYGEPFPCSSAFGMLRISQAVKQQATVLLTGDGGDDVFLGYPGHLHYWQAQRLAHLLPTPLANLWNAQREPGAATRGPSKNSFDRAARFLDYATGGLGAVEAAHDSQAYWQRWNLAGPTLRPTHLWHQPQPWSAEAGRTLLAQYLDAERQRRFTGEYMTKVDGGAMWYALEARSPFLDQDLWEFAAALPHHIRLHGGELKAVLRELSRRRIGPRVATGKKRGFFVPAERWMVTAWREEFTANLDNLELAKDGFVDPKAVRRAWEACLPTGQAPRQLWYLHAVETWLRYERGR
jgi:asparagine synthase (glutamine-hydrolysing)